MSSVGSNAPDTRHTRLIQACAQGQEATVRALFAESETQWSSQRDCDALRLGLQRVAARGNIGLTSFLLEKGAEFDSKKDSEVAALFRAAENGHKGVVRILLQKGASPEARDRYGRTSVFQAAVKGYIEVLKLLTGANANVNARDKDGRTVLIHMAAEKLFKLNLDICRFLLDAGADVEARDNGKRNALIWASDTGKSELVKLLLEGNNRASMEAYVFRNFVDEKILTVVVRTTEAALLFTLQQNEGITR